jgi:hypothetical protein
MTAGPDIAAVTVIAAIAPIDVSSLAIITVRRW